MTRQRTIYYNDARHYYLWVFEPPMKLEDAWRPIDEVAGTGIDTFIYGVERGDGLFYPSKVGMLFGEDKRPFKSAIEWRAWKCMHSLIDRGLDPLTVLIERAHDKGMDFFASLRMSGYGGMEDAHKIKVPDSWSAEKRMLLSGSLRADYAHREVREHQLAVLRELATQYPVDGVELDFAFVPFYFNPDEAEKHLSTMTDYVREISGIVRGRAGDRAEIGARVLPTEEMCLNAGLAVRAWLKEGLLDFVVPLSYQSMLLDPDMPIDWLVQAAHEADVSVYGMLQPWTRDETTNVAIWASPRAYPTPDIMRAAAASYWDRGVDGLYTWFMRWPLGDAERRMLAELADPDLISEGNKRYQLQRRNAATAATGYDASLPVEITSADWGKRHPVRFYIADDIEGASDRIRRVTLSIVFRNLVTADHLTMLLNGRSLSNETCMRGFDMALGPAATQALEFELKDVRPRKGQNLLEVSLDSRPPGLDGPVTVEQVEVFVEYGSYPSRLDPAKAT